MISGVTVITAARSRSKTVAAAKEFMFLHLFVS